MKRDVIFRTGKDGGEAIQSRCYCAGREGEEAIELMYECVSQRYEPCEAVVRLSSVFHFPCDWRTSSDSVLAGSQQRFVPRSLRSIDVFHQKYIQGQTVGQQSAVQHRANLTTGSE